MLPSPCATVSVVIVTCHRLSFLKKCVDYIRHCHAPRPIELVIVLSGKDPETREWLVSESLSESGVIWTEAFPYGKSSARNKGVQMAHGDYLYFLDDDVVVSPDLFQILQEKISQHPEADVLGGPNITPVGSNSFQRAVGFVLNSFWGAGRMRRRYRADGSDVPSDDRAMILCNMVMKRAVFEKYSVAFDEKFHYNEENVLLDTLRRRGAVVRHIPSLAVFHHRREGWLSYLRQVWHSGVGRGHMTHVLPSSLRWDFCVPPVFLLYLVFLFLLQSIWLSGPIILYGIVTLLFSVHYFVRHERSIRGMFRVFLLYFAGHAVYGAGFWAGLFRPGLNSPRYDRS